MDGGPTADGDQLFNGDELRLRLNLHSKAPGQARRRVADWLTSVGCPDDVVATMVVVTSELVTNAIVHAKSAPEVTATVSDGHVRLEVADGHLAPPVLRSDDEVRVGGYGLRVVDELTHTWGWEPTADGKRVWVETLF